MTIIPRRRLLMQTGKLSDPEKEFVSCPACGTLLHVYKSREQVHCTVCPTGFKLSTKEITEKRSQPPGSLDV